ncbi:rho guanine nucleotide exchange factor 19 [Hylobates moloch]|uniref:rho guanine nucleotide exchange factor 19 n=1 Tax=Hylobates moloch TaxID=81572 RepID=UPI0026748A16|nr:rho guanine nucleotide exchange factor 19 [Hylobates moloch]
MERLPITSSRKSSWNTQVELSPAPSSDGSSGLALANLDWFDESNSLSGWDLHQPAGQREGFPCRNSQTASAVGLGPERGASGSWQPLVPGDPCPSPRVAMAIIPRRLRYRDHRRGDAAQQGWQLATLSWCPAPSSGGTLESPTYTATAPGQPRLGEEVCLLGVGLEKGRGRDVWRPGVRGCEARASEASYIHSLSVAVGHFLGSAELSECLGAQDKQWLFSKLPEVKSTSERFLQDLEQRLEADVLRFSVCDVVLDHCPAFRRVYLPYVTNQAYQERTYQRLLLENPRFPGILARLEESPVCQGLPLTSFLILPFQRITCLKMLVENILKRTAQGSDDEDVATKAFNVLKELVQECNASVQSMKRTEELIHLSKKIHFEGKIFPLISQALWLVRHGELVELAPLPAAPPAKLKLSSKAVYLYLFNDCLQLSRRKDLGKFAVFVYAKMAELQVRDLSLKLQGIPGHVFLLQLLHGQHMKHQFLLRARTESEKQRWISALCPSSPQEDKEVISEGEDCPQVQCVRTYKALHPDELTLEKTDILAVRTWTSDGWLEGVRLADGEKGWVPQAYVEEISSLSARLRNLRENKRVTSATSKLGEAPV